LTKSTKLINELFDNYVSNYLTSYGSPYLTLFQMLVSCNKNHIIVFAMNFYRAMISVRLSVHLERSGTVMTCWNTLKIISRLNSLKNLLGLTIS